MEIIRVHTQKRRERRRHDRKTTNGLLSFSD